MPASDYSVFAGAWNLRELLTLAAAGGLDAQQPVWVSARPRQLHWFDDCRGTALAAATATTLAEHARTAEAENYTSCPVCEQHAAPLVASLGRWQPVPVNWLRNALSWLDPERRPVDQDARHLHLVSTRLAAQLLGDLSPALTRAVAAVRDRIEERLAEDHRTGLARRVGWQHALGNPATDRWMSEADRAAAEQFRSWSSQARAYVNPDPCPIELADLDALTARVLTDRAWVLVDRLALRWPSGWTLTVDRTAVVDGWLLARTARALLPDGLSDGMELLGDDGDYTTAEVVAAYRLGGTGDRLGDLVAALRATTDSVH